ncbi:glycosyltransferase family 2 protein [Flaviaesturariibacter amylovorans]|uniref:Glycosyltransferase 2-like domain-containing protein n=1 Tax=Flaviaesturariibacter amylovorans TaxID=1084520 RepID=A0ABP8HEK9_9BACT
MTPHEPKITVLMPAYNVARYIADAVRSVLAQTFTDFELLVIDDGSTDNTASVVRTFADPRIRLVRQANSGVAGALNTGLELARAPLVARFDADDICYPQRLAVQYAALQEDPSLVVLGSAADYIDAERRFVFAATPPALTDAAIRAQYQQACPFIHSSVLYRKADVIAAGGYDLRAHSFEDHLLWGRLLQAGTARNLDTPLIQVRLNAQSVTIDERWRTARFRALKSEVLQRGAISAEEGEELKAILQKQDRRRIKEGAYHALIGKKYLWNNYQPAHARRSLRRALACRPFYATGYGLLAASFLPEAWLRRIYQTIKKSG